ncbi:MAG: TlpA family protein disulfide reductase [Bacteroidales bacterium]|nr:TlpA family protein disulfide reductase [Bacteroidales bacterium]
MKNIRIFLILSLTAFAFYSFITAQNSENIVKQYGKTTLEDGKEVVIGTEIGNKAPEITQANTEGKEISLSDLKGKMVLIDFWASWCGPCRRENPNVVSVYEEFQDKKFKSGKGFTVFSVSFDNSKDKWLDAIEKDKLSWEYHVSDLKGWGNKYAGVYGVRGIPYNFLIDKDGIIVAKNLRGSALKAELEKHLKE